MAYRPPRLSIAPLRPPVLLAKQAATLQALSRGRLVLGVASSWQKGEYEALGVPFEERGQRLDETLAACRALWAGAPASYASRHVNFDDVNCSPRPSHAQPIPIWFGGAFSPRLVRRIVAGGDGWILLSGLGETMLQVGLQRYMRSPAEAEDFVHRLAEAFATLRGAGRSS